MTIDNLNRDNVPSEHSRIIKKMIPLGGKNEGVKIAISDDGFVCVFGSEREDALTLINTIFTVVTLTLNITTFVAKRDDLCECFQRGM